VLSAEVMWLVAEQVGGNQGRDALARMLVGGTAGVVTYVGVLVALGAPEVRAVRDRLPMGRRSTVR